MSAPKSVDEFNEKLRERTADFPKRVKQCAEYLSAHTDEIALSTVAELSERAGVQPSAMMRFCQVMGFAGFSEMQALFRKSISGAMPDYAKRLEDIRKSDAGGPMALLAEFVDSGRKSLDQITATIDTESLTKAVSTLAMAKVIHIIGLRRAFPAAAYLAYAFEKMEVPSVLHHGGGGLNQGHSMTDGDVLVAITFAPYSTETVSLVQNCQERGRPVVAISDSVISPVNSGNVQPLLVSEIDFGNFRSLSGTLCLALTLAVAVGAAREEHISEKLC